MGSRILRSKKLGARISIATLTAQLALGSLSFGLMPTVAFALLSGLNSADVFANDATVGSVDWSNPSNAAASEDTRASITLSSSGISRYLKATDFDFTIPSDATIDGITVEVERQAQSANDVNDSAVRIVKGGVISSAQNKASATLWTTSDVTATYGSSSDLWGETWTAADVNATTFGVVIAAKRNGGGGNKDARIDHIRVTVNYTEAVSSSSSSSSSSSESSSSSSVSSFSSSEVSSSSSTETSSTSSVESSSSSEYSSSFSSEYSSYGNTSFSSSSSAAADTDADSIPDVQVCTTTTTMTCIPQPDMCIPGAPVCSPGPEVCIESVCTPGPMICLPGPDMCTPMPPLCTLVPTTTCNGPDNCPNTFNPGQDTDACAEDNDNDGGNTTNGSYRGSRTNVMRSILAMFGGDPTGLPPPAFGGPGDGEFTDEESALVCRMYNAIADDAERAVYEWAAEQLSLRMPHSVESIYDALRDGGLCPVEVVRLKTVKPIAFRIDAAGFPVSSNDTWNKCIRGTATLEDIRNNPDRDEDGYGNSCSRYHTQDLWRHPDLLTYFTWKKGTMSLLLPAGYALKQDVVVTQN